MLQSFNQSLVASFVWDKYSIRYFNPNWVWNKNFIGVVCFCRFLHFQLLSFSTFFSCCFCLLFSSFVWHFLSLILNFCFCLTQFLSVYHQNGWFVYWGTFSVLYVHLLYIHRLFRWMWTLCVEQDQDLMWALLAAEDLYLCESWNFTGCSEQL